MRLACAWDLMLASLDGPVVIAFGGMLVVSFRGWSLLLLTFCSWLGVLFDHVHSEFEVNCLYLTLLLLGFP